jgi:hypothetical protein
MMIFQNFRKLPTVLQVNPLLLLRRDLPYRRVFCFGPTHRMSLKYLADYDAWSNPETAVLLVIRQKKTCL